MSAPDLSYWEDAGARTIADFLIVEDDRYGSDEKGITLAEVRARIEHVWEQGDEITTYTDHDVTWTAAGVALELRRRGYMNDADAREALDVANWDLDALRDEPTAAARVNADGAGPDGLR